VKRFRFDLQKLLELRAYAERDAELNLARALGEAGGIQERLRAVAQERVAVAAERFKGGRSVAEIKSVDLYLLRLDHTKETLLDAAAKAELKVAQLREVFIEASRERRVLDKLREKRFSEYRKNASREEIKTLDDLSSGTRARQSALEGI